MIGDLLQKDMKEWLGGHISFKKLKGMHPELEPICWRNALDDMTKLQRRELLDEVFPFTIEST